MVMIDLVPGAEYLTDRNQPSVSPSVAVQRCQYRFEALPGRPAKHHCHAC
jgi:hypothetical protein